MKNAYSLPAENNPVILSLIIPVYNEREVLPRFIQRLDSVIRKLGISSEVIFVDDGSRDGSTEFITNKTGKVWDTRIIKLSRNFGKEAALTAGLDYACGEAVIILDADLQDPPELISEMIEQWQNGADVVLMQRSSRAGESWLKRSSAHLFYRLLNQLSNPEIPVDTGDFRLMSRCAVDAIKRLPERNRFMKGLFAWVGLPTIVLKYDRDPRAGGISKWDYLGLLKLALEGITSFSIAPLRWTMATGIIAALIGGSYGFWIIIKAFILGDPVQGYPSLIAIITFLGGIQLLAVGIVGEYIGKTYLEAKQRPNYLVRDIVDIPGSIKLCSLDGIEVENHAEAI